LSLFQIALHHVIDLDDRHHHQEEEEHDDVTILSTTSSSSSSSFSSCSTHSLTINQSINQAPMVSMNE